MVAIAAPETPNLIINIGSRIILRMAPNKVKSIDILGKPTILAFIKKTSKIEPRTN